MCSHVLKFRTQNQGFACIPCMCMQAFKVYMLPYVKKDNNKKVISKQYKKPIVMENTKRLMLRHWQLMRDTHKKG